MGCVVRLCLGGGGRVGVEKQREGGEEDWEEEEGEERKEERREKEGKRSCKGKDKSAVG